MTPQAAQETMPTVFDYQGSPVAFSLDAGQVWVNATQMAKPFGKQPADYTRSERTQELISAISSDMGIPVSPEFKENSHLVKTVHGNGGGTWLHRDLALDFARWLSPTFAIWCDKKVQELLEKGRVELAAPADPVIGALMAIGQLTSVMTQMRSESLALAAKVASQDTELAEVKALAVEAGNAAKAYDEVVKALPQTKEITPRMQITQLVRKAAFDLKQPFNGVYRDLYREFRNCEGVDLLTRAEHADKTPLDIAEDLGLVETLLAYAVKMFARRKRSAV